MDLQDVSNLTIPEGNVKTIHDKDSRLLWGAVGYDVKYRGDTSQNGTPTPDAPAPVNVVTGTQNVWVHGKNLLPFTDQDFTVNNVRFYVGDGTLYANGNSTGETYSSNINWKNNFSFVLSAGTYTVSLRDGAISAYIKKQSDDSNIAVVNGVTLKSATFTLGETTPLYCGFYMYQNSFSDTRLALQLESGVETTYEPYTGATYTINLGSIELCKIGDYQDKIYQSGGEWYVHKALKKMVLDGNENWTHQTGGGGFNGRVDLLVGDSVLGSASNNPIISDHYISKFALENNVVFLSGAAHQFSIIDQAHAPSTQSADLTGWKSWLAANNTTVYYALATATDTQITDSTLIGQLNAIHEWLTRYGYNATVTGNLPIIIDKTNL